MVHSRRSLIIVLVAVVFLTGCDRGFADGDTHEAHFRAALRVGDWSHAAMELHDADRAPWQRATEALVGGHGALRIAAASTDWNGAPSFDYQDVIYRLAFADGYERCLWLRGQGGDPLAIRNGGYVDCATIAAPGVSHGVPTPRGTPAP